MFNRRHKKKYTIDADEVFLDSRNLPFFNKQQFEGKIEKPLSKKTIYVLMFFILLVAVLFIIRLFTVQVKNGKTYFQASEENALYKELVFAERGIIYDRQSRPLAWNEKNPLYDQFLSRVYNEESGLSHILGYVKYPKKDQKGYFWRTEYVGMDGIEKQFNEKLSGKNGARLIETDVRGEHISANMYELAVPGENVVLSLDKEVQTMLYESIRRVAIDSGYVGASGALVDITTGEIISMASYPEYNSNIMTESKNEEIISGYFSSFRYPLLNRAVSGIYAPGSIVKPFVGIGALTEGVITKNTKIASIGSITIPNVYNPSLSSVFRDLRPNNGIVNIQEALSVSSNIFFYNVGGGYQSQKGIGIENIGKYWKLFGLSQKTGIELPGELEGLIPSIEWKKNTFPNDPVWRLGDTYNTAIGQYGVQVTPVQMVRAVAAIALDGKLIPLTIIKKESPLEIEKMQTIDIPQEHFSTIKSGMRLAVTSSLGTAKGLVNLQTNFAAKTGTAQVGANNNFINTWIIGFFPYEKPRYAFVILMDKGTSTSAAGAPTAALYFFQRFENSEFYKNGQ